MPYKDIKVQKEYQRKWYLRKKQGLPTKTVISLSEEERIKRRRATIQKACKKKRFLRKQAKYDKLGDICRICSRKQYNLHAHRKDGKPHKEFHALTNEEYKKELDSGEYVHLCYRCHKGVHFCLDILKLTWSEIIKRLNK